MQTTSLWPVLLSNDEPCRLHFQREPQSTVIHGRASPPTRRQIEISSPFIACKDNGRTLTFIDIETGESWAQITKTSPSEEDPTDVLSAPSLGITQLPVSRFLDDMDGIYCGRRTFRMRTPYGAHTWFHTESASDTVILECQHPQEDDYSSIAASLLEVFSISSQGTSGTPTEIYQPPHFDADPDFHARWPFNFNLRVVYNTTDDFSLEITLSDMLSDASIVEEATRALAHAAIIAIFVMNYTIHMESRRTDSAA